MISSITFFFLTGVCRLSGAAGPDRYLHARQDPHTEDLSHPDLPSSLVAEDPREHRYGSVSGGLELRAEEAMKSQVTMLIWVWEIYPGSS